MAESAKHVSRTGYRGPVSKLEKLTSITSLGKLTVKKVLSSDSAIPQKAHRRLRWYSSSS